MKKKKYWGILLILIFACSCNPRKSAQENIAGLEKKLYADTITSFDREMGLELMNAYTAFAEKYPQDGLAPDYLFRSAEMAMSLGQQSDAINFLEKLRSGYPDHGKAPSALFMQAFIYENQLKNLPMAQKFYSQFIKEYPGHDLAADAQFSLNNLGKSEEEILKQFEAVTPN